MPATDPKDLSLPDTLDDLKSGLQLFFHLGKHFEDGLSKNAHLPHSFSQARSTDLYSLQARLAGALPEAQAAEQVLRGVPCGEKDARRALAEN